MYSWKVAKNNIRRVCFLLTHFKILAQPKPSNTNQPEQGCGIKWGVI